MRMACSLEGWNEYSAYERQVELMSAAGEQVLEGAADRAFVIDLKLTELAQHLVVILHELVRGLQVEGLHGLRPVYNGKIAPSLENCE